MNIQSIHSNLAELRWNTAGAKTQKLPAPVVRPSNYESKNISSVVHISAAARNQLVADAKMSGTPDDSILRSTPGTRGFAALSSLSLSDLVSKYDMTNITPRQMATLSSELVQRNEITIDESLTGFETAVEDTATPIGRDQAVNMFSFTEMMSALARNSVGNSGSPAADQFSIEYYAAQERVVRDISSFLTGGREHIRA